MYVYIFKYILNLCVLWKNCILDYSWSLTLSLPPKSMSPDPFHHPGGTWRDLPDRRIWAQPPPGDTPLALLLSWHFNRDNNEENACLEPRFMNFPVLLWPVAVEGALFLPLLTSCPLCWQPTHIMMLFLIIYFFLDGNNAVFFHPPFAGRQGEQLPFSISCSWAVFHDASRRTVGVWGSVLRLCKHLSSPIMSQPIPGTALTLLSLVLTPCLTSLIRLIK